MNKRGTGVVFCFISAFLYSARLIAAALLAGDGFIGESDVYRALKLSTGYEVVVFSVASLIIGLIYLYQADFMKGNKDT